MSRTSKSPMKVAQVAYHAGRQALPRYAHKFSRRDYTCAQLFAILVLRKFFKTDYRGIQAILSEWTDLRQILELGDKVPHFTTPQKASTKLLGDALIRKLLTQTLAQFYKLPEVDDDDLAWVQRIDLAAADSTGFESNHCSRYFAKRRKQGKNKDEPVEYHRWPKMNIAVDLRDHLILSTRRSLGPKPDVDELEPLMSQLCGNVIFDCFLADAGFDSEKNHELMRERFGIPTLIPPTAGRPSESLPKSKWRWLMATDFDEETYGQRWSIETVMFMLKSRLGAALTARADTTRHQEMGLLAVAHNLLIVRIIKLFYRAYRYTFNDPALGSDPFGESVITEASIIDNVAKTAVATAFIIPVTSLSAENIPACVLTQIAFIVPVGATFALVGFPFVIAAAFLFPGVTAATSAACS